MQLSWKASARSVILSILVASPPVNPPGACVELWRRMPLRWAGRRRNHPDRPEATEPPPYFPPSAKSRPSRSSSAATGPASPLLPVVGSDWAFASDAYGRAVASPAPWVPDGPLRGRAPGDHGSVAVRLRPSVGAGLFG
eukprot:8189121-Alexandrium_andersonii.AAC.1